MSIDTFGDIVCKFGPLIIASAIIMAAVIGIVFAPNAIANSITETEIIQDILKAILTDEMSQQLP